MFTNQEKFILSNIGKLMQLICMAVIVLIIFLDPLRGRPTWYFGWIRITGLMLSISSLLFSIWFDKFLNAIVDIHDR